MRVGNLDPTRDFSYVEDTASAFLLAGLADVVGEEINLGTGREISIGNLVKLIAKLMQKEKYSIKKEN